MSSIFYSFRIVLLHGFAAMMTLLLRLINEFRNQGIQVPYDVSVAGFDGISTAFLFHPKLCTYMVRIDTLGYRGVELLLNRINKKRIPLQILLCTGESRWRRLCGRAKNWVCSSLIRCRTNMSLVCVFCSSGMKWLPWNPPSYQFSFVTVSFWVRRWHIVSYQSGTPLPFEIVSLLPKTLGSSFSIILPFLIML